MSQGAAHGDGGMRGGEKIPFWQFAVRGNLSRMLKLDLSGPDPQMTQISL